MQPELISPLKLLYYLLINISFLQIECLLFLNFKKRTSICNHYFMDVNHLFCTVSHSIFSLSFLKRILFNASDPKYEKNTNFHGGNFERIEFSDLKYLQKKL